MKFSEINLNKNIQKSLKELNFEKATPVQEKAIPFLLENNQDLISLAQTGTGKTAAFGLPIINKVDVKKKRPQSIILCPTRELCLQISKDLKLFASNSKDLRITPIYGGSDIRKQMRELKMGSHIVVGTPGRVLDLLKRKNLELNKIESVVLDEADEMLNMGFKEDIDSILEGTNSKKQILLFSATMPKEVLKISKNYMNKPKKIEVDSTNEGVKDLEHNYYLVMNLKDKYQVLRRICDINPNVYGIVFCRTRRECKDISNKLVQDGYNADSLNGDLSQPQRDHVMNRFREKHIQLLVATDVAARGLDVNDLSHVINYNLPDENQTYVHRSGRTGRAGKKGISIIIGSNRDRRKIKTLEKTINKDIIKKEIPKGKEICEAQLMNLIDRIVNSEVNKDIEKFIPSILDKISHLNREDLLKQLVSLEFSRFLSFYNNVSDISSDERKRNSDSRKAEKGFSRFFINLGKKHNLRPQNLIGIINDYTKNKDISIGKIDIMQGFSFFEVATNYEKEILSSLKKFMWNNYKCSVELSKAVGDSSKSRDRDKPRKSFKRGGKRTKPRNSFRRKRR
ncbi:MAG: DEAD/DEAH box helicase [Cytophagia bacterium]|jgi:ATP-dependent RNA helicase DeaD|nr:DEAD/DEAH box helicase [Cytophagia bacterium]